jgi:thiamine-phosphate pyrophosphorylase
MIKRKKEIGRLHILTDDVLQSTFSHVQLAQLAVKGGADTIQFRQKAGSTKRLIEIARRMRAVCHKQDAIFIVNDRVDVAVAVDADGVHLGQEDFPIPLARKLLGKGKIIGGSAATPEEAEKCFSEGADYVGFGPVYPTASKTDAGPVSGIRILKKVVQETPLPIIAIGGITSERVSEVMKTGAYGIAVISAVCCEKEPEAATRFLQDALKACVTEER